MDVLEADDHESDRDHEREEAAEEQGPAAEAALRLAEEEGEEDDRRDLRHGGARDHDLAEARAGDACVEQDRDDHAEAGGREHDREQERGLRESGPVQSEADRERDPERDEPARERRLHDPPAQVLEVDLETGDQEQEGDPDQRHHLDGGVDLGPAEHLRADHDPEAELDDERRGPQAGDEAERERGAERHRRHDRQVRERDLRHGGPSAGVRRRYVR